MFYDNQKISQQKNTPKIFFCVNNSSSCVLSWKWLLLLSFLPPPFNFQNAKNNPKVCVFYQEVDMRNPMYMCFDFKSEFHLDAACARAFFEVEQIKLTLSTHTCVLVWWGEMGILKWNNLIKFGILNSVLNAE